MRYYLIAGEPSGDLHGANLMTGLKMHDTECEFRFWGGDSMAAVAGAQNLAKHYRETSFFGFIEVLRNIRTISHQFKECQADIDAFAPDVLILIDYPGFNLRMARWAKERGIRTYYYIAPKVWAWNKKRIKAIKKYVDDLFIIFPFEQKYFGDRDVEATFEGNPLVDAIEARRATLPTADEFRKMHNLDQRPIIGLLAGSRKSEIEANLPLMVALSREFAEYQFVVTGVPWLDRELYQKHITDSSVRYICDATYQTLNVSEAAVVTSGTATLETALLNIPEIVLYRTWWLFANFHFLVLRIPYISLVNIILDRESVKELIQSTLDTTVASRELRAIIKGGSKREQMLKDFGELRGIIGAAGASERFAKVMIERLKNRTFNTNDVIKR